MNNELEFIEFPKMPRLSRDIIITEKIDGTNACIYITEDGDFYTGSRTRWITPDNDNYGFSRWAHENKDELMKLGAGRHFGEWWGNGIQRGYGLAKGEKRFSLFNASRWVYHTEAYLGYNLGEKQQFAPICCHVVPILYKGNFDTTEVDGCLKHLELNGSEASPSFMKPEGIVVYHTAGNFGFKKTIEKDETPKTLHEKKVA